MAICCALPLRYQRPSLLIIGLLIILTIFQEFVRSSDVEFVAHPGDLSVKEGESGSFNCTLRASLPFASAKSYWENGLTKPLYQSDICNVTTTSDNITKIISSYLTIHNVRRDMNKLYKCWIRLQISDDYPTAVSSEFASLDVLYFLKDEELNCRGPSGPMLQEGDQITIECEGVKTYPQAILRWLGPLSASSSFFRTGSLLVGNITVTPSLHNHLLICVAESEAFPGEQVNCSLGQYTVIHSPRVEVIPHQTEMIWPSVTQKTFHCIASGYPEVKEYRWFCHPEELFSQCTSHSRIVTIILDAVQMEETLIIFCEATNDVGTSQNDSIINVRYLNESLLDVCKLNSMYLPGMTKKGESVILHDTRTDTLKCWTEVSSMEEVSFRWYLDGLLTTENKGELYLTKSVEGSSHLLVYSSVNVSGRGIAACNFRLKKSYDWSLAQLVTCKFTSVDQGDPTSNVKELWQGTTKVNNVSHSITQLKHSTKILISVPIAVGCGLLFCLILIILASQNSTACRRKNTQHGTGAQLTGGIQLSVHGSPSHSSDDIPVYEIPDVDLGRSISTKKAFTVSHFMSGRCMNVDRYLEEEEEEVEKGRQRGGGGKGGGEEESFPESVNGSEENDSSSSAENQDISFLSYGSNESNVPVVDGIYANHEVESLT